MPDTFLCGVVNVRTDGVVGTSGATYRVYDIINTCGATTSNITLYDGTSTSGTPICTLQGLTTDSAILNFSAGIRFESGIYLAFASSVTSRVCISLVTEF